MVFVILCVHYNTDHKRRCIDYAHEIKLKSANAKQVYYTVCHCRLVHSYIKIYCL